MAGIVRAVLCTRQTMSGWVIQLHERLTLLMALMKQLLYRGRVIHIDETRLQVLNEPLPFPIIRTA